MISPLKIYDQLVVIWFVVSQAEGVEGKESWVAAGVRDNMLLCEKDGFSAGKYGKSHA